MQFSRIIGCLRGMSNAHNTPIGLPSLDLSDDELETVVALVCTGIEEARAVLSCDLLEVPLTHLLRKSMKRAKRHLGLTSIEIHGEYEVDDLAADGPEVVGRIDIIFKFLRQFGDENAYLAIECKRVGAGMKSLNKLYVVEGVSRFASGQYSAGHKWAMLLGFVLKGPVQDVVSNVDSYLLSIYGAEARLRHRATNRTASMHDSSLRRGSSLLSLIHMFADIT
jgi:hypothetical protein